MGTGFPGTTPNPSFVTLNETGAVLVAAASTVLTTAAGIKGGDVPKTIIFTVTLTATGDEIVTYQLFRDGVELVAADRYDAFASAGGPTSQTFHWVDPTPGKALPIYSVRAFGATGGVATVDNRRLTVVNTP